MSGAAHDNNWMPLYIGDYLRDTTRLTAAEHGAYLLLIMDYWVNGPPPDDDRQLAAIARTSLHVWRQHRRKILEKLFYISNQKWMHKRVEFERARAHELSEKKRRGGLASAGVRRSRNGTAKPEDSSQDSCQDSSQDSCDCVRTQSQESSLAPYRARENSLAHALAREDRPETSPPLPSLGDGDAASGSPTPEPPAATSGLDDPELRAYGNAAFDRCIDAIRGKLGTLDSQATEPPPPDPRLVEFRARLQRLNALAGERLDGDARWQAWEILARADALGDPNAIPPPMLAELAAIESLDAYAAAAE